VGRHNPIMKTYDLVIIGLLAALAGVFQVTHGVLGIPTGFGMTVDLVAVPALLALYLFGFEHALWVLVIASLIITVVAPDSWLGASMKFAATLPMIAVPALYLLSTKSRVHFAVFLGAFFVLSLAAFALSGGANLALSPVIPKSLPGGSLILGLAPVALFCLMALALLYVWRAWGAGLRSKPLRNEAIAVTLLVAALALRGLAMVISNYYYAGPLFWGMSPDKLIAMVPWYAIAGWNAFQGILEVGVAWVVAYRFGFAERYGRW